MSFWVPVAPPVVVGVCPMCGRKARWADEHSVYCADYAARWSLIGAEGDYEREEDWDAKADA